MRILVVEDEFLIAEQLTRDIAALGDSVIGPFPDIAGAMGGLAGAGADAAILDVRLGGQTSFCIADRLRLRAVPFVFLTAHTRHEVPDRFRRQPVHSKPSPTRDLLLQLHAHRLRHGPAEGAREVLVDMLSYVRLLASDAQAAERLVERVMLQAIDAVEGAAPPGGLRALMVALMDREIARNLPQHFH